MRVKVAILGSTGSIGKNAVKVALENKDIIEVVALAAKSNIDLLQEQAALLSPKIVAVYDKEKALELQKKIPGIHVVAGMEGLCEVVVREDVDLVLAAMVGSAGLVPTVEAIRAKKRIALANKEVLVAAGSYVMPLVKKMGVELIPVDSEHNAIFQCLHREEKKTVRRIILTSSGGPFRGKTKEDLKNVTVEDALKHPNFSMGAKITVDSSTMMNKGLEVIEAHFLFELPLEKIEVLIHPEQKIHGMVEFCDGSLIAQMCEPDMVVPIQYAMTYPYRKEGLLPPYDFIKNGALHFLPPNIDLFRPLKLAYEAARVGGTLPCYMNAANEVLVESFLQKKISWLSIGQMLENLMERHNAEMGNSLETFLEVDSLARNQAREMVCSV
jgi:1-deoxy-D-xylulose-5-phosphate reductoisomerase